MPLTSNNSGDSLLTSNKSLSINPFQTQNTWDSVMDNTLLQRAYQKKVDDYINTVTSNKNSEIFDHKNYEKAVKLGQELGLDENQVMQDYKVQSPAIESVHPEAFVINPMQIINKSLALGYKGAMGLNRLAGVGKAVGNWFERKLPGIGQAVTGASVVEGTRHLAGPEGIRKTISKFQEGDIGGAGWSLLGDTFDAIPGGNMLRERGLMAKNAYRASKLKFPDFDLEKTKATPWFRELSEKYGPEQAELYVKTMQTPEFKNFFIGDNPLATWDAGMQNIKDSQVLKAVEDAGGILGGSAGLARLGTVKRNGLYHDLDFNVPGNTTKVSSQVFTKLKAKPIFKWINWHPAQLQIPPKQWVMRNPGQASVNAPHRVNGVYTDMFINDAPEVTQWGAASLALKFKLKVARPKDVKDLKNWKLYSELNPAMDAETGIGQWNPTQFSKGFMTPEGYPQVMPIETYPGSGLFIPSVMNRHGATRGMNYDFSRYVAPEYLEDTRLTPLAVTPHLFQSNEK